MVTSERTGAPVELALAELHESLGARFVAEGGVAVPESYGDPAAELAALRAELAVIDLSWQGRLELRGRDRQRFLNGLVTSNVNDLAAGSGIYGMLLNKQGRVLADLYATALDDRLWLELPAGESDRVRRHLESYRVIDDVEIAPLEDMVLIGVLGPGAAAALGSVAASLGCDRTARATIGGTEVQIVRRAVFGIEGFVLWTVSALAADLFTELAGGGAGPEAGGGASSSRAAGMAALDALRIEAGVPRWGVDFDAETVANESGLLERAVDFTKGCYLGQEIVARIHYRGKPSTLCVAVEGRAPSVPPLPAAIRSAGADGASGRLTSATAVAPESWLGIAALERRALDAGGPWQLAGGGEVRLRDGGL